ncbi:TPA: hypothetical protein HLV26_10885 [Escherichia coli]|nr:hypothetical protein FGG77_00395 [Escherichia coli]HAJ3973715.1 hypothetical protein [Escherichia coli]HAJ4002950.1 hypothetical protein [Escherichia coli]HAJ4470875.1 hypothetical protein [Escherichia coli]HAJ4584484.1 hypothetical protein [Escherichia coli]
MSDRVIECASRVGRDFSEFMKGEKGMMEALASVDEFGEQLRLNGCVNHHFVSYMMRNSIMQAFMDMAKAERKEERRRKRAEAKADQQRTEEHAAATEAVAERRVETTKEASNVQQSVNHMLGDDVDRELRNNWTRPGSR